MNIAIPKWAPRLARLFTRDVRDLEARHADRISPGAKTWEDAFEALSQRMGKLGPVKGPKLVAGVVEYLESVPDEQRCHLVIVARFGSRAVFLMLAALDYGRHPNPAVDEEGVSIRIHMLVCSRSSRSRATGIPVAYISLHALKRIYERSDDVVEHGDAFSAAAYVAALGYIVHFSARHAEGGMSLRVGDLLLVGAMCRFPRATDGHNGAEDILLDIRSALPVAELAPWQQRQLEQGDAAGAAVYNWFTDSEASSLRALAESIPAMPRREHSYSVQRAQTGGTMR